MDMDNVILLIDEMFPTKRLYPVAGKGSYLHTSSASLRSFQRNDLTQSSGSQWDLNIEIKDTEFPTKRLNPVVGKKRSCMWITQRLSVSNKTT